jgi:hypothetical protein
VASSDQSRTVERLRRVDPSIAVEEVGEQVFVSFTPAWEKGRMSKGEYRPNPNPQRLTMYVHTDGRLYGWGFGNEAKPPVELARSITQKSDLAEALKARVEARKPKTETTPKVEAKITTNTKASTAKRTTTRKKSSAAK